MFSWARGCDEFKVITIEFNDLIPAEEWIDFEFYVDIDRYLSVSAPLNESGLIEKEVIL